MRKIDTDVVFENVRLSHCDGAEVTLWMMKVRIWGWTLDRGPTRNSLFFWGAPWYAVRSTLRSWNVFEDWYSRKCGLLPNVGVKGFKKYISRRGIYWVLTDQSPRHYWLLTFKLSLSVLIFIIISRFCEMSYNYRCKKLLTTFPPAIITVRGGHQVVYTHGFSESFWYLISSPASPSKKTVLKTHVTESLV